MSINDVNMVKYKLELEMPDSFEKGCCYDCYLAEYSEFTEEYSCIIPLDWYDDCPLEKVSGDQSYGRIVWIFL